MTRTRVINDLMMAANGVRVGDRIQFLDSEVGQMKITSVVIKGMKSGRYIWVLTNTGTIYSNYQMDPKVADDISSNAEVWRHLFPYNYERSIDVGLHSEIEPCVEDNFLDTHKHILQKQADRCWQTSKAPYQINNLHNTIVYEVKNGLREKITFEDIKPGMSIIFSGSELTDPVYNLHGKKDLKIPNVIDVIYNKAKGEVMIESNSKIFINTDCYR